MLFYEQLGVDVAYDLGQGSVVVIFFGVLYKSKLGPLLLVPWSNMASDADVIFFRFAHSSLTFQNCVISYRVNKILVVMHHCDRISWKNISYSLHIILLYISK